MIVQKIEHKKYCKNMREKDDRIKIFLHDRNLGSNKNFEFLLRQVESKFYMLSDQDDVWLPEKIEKTIQKQKRNRSRFSFWRLRSSK